MSPHKPVPHESPAPPSQPSAHLVIHGRFGLPNQMHPLLEGWSTTIGREPGNVIVLQDLGVSRTHCGIACQDGTFWLTNFNSTNGTFLNGRRIERERLSHADVIRIGDIEMEFRLNPAPRKPTGAAGAAGASRAPATWQNEKTRLLRDHPGLPRTKT